MQITFVTRNFRIVERHLHCDVLHVTTVRVTRLVLDCNGVFAIKAYIVDSHETASNKFLLSAPFNIFFIMMHMKCTCAY